MENSESKKLSKQKRRSKNDNKNRHYECSCGKKYLSYPALYTHMKNATKENGEEIHIPRNKNDAKENKQRGRPSNNPDGEDVDYDTKVDIDCLTAIENYLLYLSNKEAKYILELNEDCIDFVECFTFPECTEIKKYLDTFKVEKYENRETDKEIGIDELVRVKLVPCNYIFAHFLFKISENISKDCYHDICLMLIWFQKTLNVKGWTILEEIVGENEELTPDEKNLQLEDIKKQKEESETFCHSCNGNDLIYAINDFINDIPKFWDEDKGNYTKDTVLFKNQEEMINEVLEFSKYFASWLVGNWYSNNNVSA